MPNVRAEDLQRLTKEIFSKKGATDENAEIVSELLVKANLAGHDSHGVMRIPRYAKEIDDKKLDPAAKGKLELDRGAVGLFNGNSGFGQVVATGAMKTAIRKAKEFGVSAISIHNCGHIGRMADYAMMASDEGMIGMTMVNSNPAVAPFGGVERNSNPSPIGAWVPTANAKNRFILDISMSTCAVGKIHVKKARGEKLPEGWIIDKEGNPSVEPDAYLDGGSILPIGGNVGYKGYGLAFLVDILAGILSGNGASSSKEFKYGNGVLMLVIDASSFGSLDLFKGRVDETIERVRNSKKAKGVKRIMIPGEPELIEEEVRRRDGIFVEDPTWADISSIAKNLGVSVPVPIATDAPASR